MGTARMVQKMAAIRLFFKPVWNHGEVNAVKYHWTEKPSGGKLTRGAVVKEHIRTISRGRTKNNITPIRKILVYHLN